MEERPVRVPAKRRRGKQPTYTPARLGGVASAILQGDSIAAACAGAGVLNTTYAYWKQRGEAALNEARESFGIEDAEGEIWEWVVEGGGFGTADRTQWYWTAPHPDWWPESSAHTWMYALFAVVILWARGRAEQFYRMSITRAAQGDPSRGVVADWRAAQFMLTHSFGWRSAERLEVTGRDGGPIEMQVGEEQVLTALERLARRHEAMTVEVVDELDQ